MKYNTLFGSDNWGPVNKTILETIVNYMCQSNPSYGEDKLSYDVLHEIVRLFDAKEAHFAATGTGSNLICFSGSLRPGEAIVCSDCAHLMVDECGAIELALGIKLYPIRNTHGKITANQVYKLAHQCANNYHAAKPRVITITQPTGAEQFTH
ncbi:MAG: beta-eliminating lyase-related protein [Bdellovibrionota bacterium]